MAASLVRKTAEGWVSDYPKGSKVPCPKCGHGTMVARVNKATGTIFAGCSDFPKCKWHTKTRYELEYGGGSVLIRLSEEKIAENLYGLPLAELYRKVYGKAPPPDPQPEPYRGPICLQRDPVDDVLYDKDEVDYGCEEEFSL